MAPRTRDKLIETAKQLFIRNGVHNTTIADIAEASDKGRRTIYTYFNSKTDIFNAVIETESERMMKQLTDITQANDCAAEKLRKFLELRVTVDRNNTSPYSILKSLLSMDMVRWTETRRKASEKEKAMLEAILAEGVANGEFDAYKTGLMQSVIGPNLRSIDRLSASDETAPMLPSFPAAFSLLVTESILAHPAAADTEN